MKFLMNFNYSRPSGNEDYYIFGQIMVMSISESGRYVFKGSEPYFRIYKSFIETWAFWFSWIYKCSVSQGYSQLSNW